MSSSVRDITESTDAEGRDDTHHPHVDGIQYRTPIRIGIGLR